MVTLERDADVEPGKIYLQLDAYELGQIVALLPDVAWNRMDRELRAKFKAAQSEIEADRKPKPKRRKKAVAAEGHEIARIELGTATVPDDAPIPDSFINLSPEPEQAPDESVDRIAIESSAENPMADDDFFE